jgi:hypothetical protein
MPVDEARYWRSFNIPPPEEGPSETLVRRAFYAQFTDPQSVELRFPRAYATNQAWEAALGWPLFKPLHEDDRHVLHKLHVPLGDTAGEFDEQVLYLAKLLVDSLNEEALADSVEKRKGDEGLAKLERVLDGLGVPNARLLLKPFADVQGLRSRGAAHRKGSDFDIDVALGGQGRQAGFESLMQAAVVALDALRDIAEEQAAHSLGPNDLNDPLRSTREAVGGADAMRLSRPGGRRGASDLATIAKPICTTPADAHLVASADLAARPYRAGQR